MALLSPACLHFSYACLFVCILLNVPGFHPLHDIHHTQMFHVKEGARKGREKQKRGKRRETHGYAP